MGHWGYEPYENDAAQDMLYEVSDDYTRKQLTKLFKKRLRSGHIGQMDKYSRIGVLQELLLMRKMYVPTAVVRQAIEWLDELLADEDWPTGWKDPAKAVKATKKIRSQLVRLYNESAGDVVYAPKRRRKISRRRK